MGYRSDVAIAIHKDLQGEFLTFLKTTRVMAEIFQGFTLDKDFKGDGHWLFTEKQIKWYDCDPEHYPEIDLEHWYSERPLTKMFEQWPFNYVGRSIES